MMKKLSSHYEHVNIDLFELFKINKHAARLGI